MTFLLKVGRRAEEFSEAQHTMRESVVQRRTMAEEAEDARSSSPPADPTNGGGDFGGKFLLNSSQGF